MILLDASALLALLYDEPAADEVTRLLRGGECATPSTCIAEVVDQLIRRNGVQPALVVDHLDPLIEVSLGVVPVENRLGWRAGELRASHYERGGAELSLSDCALLAAAGPGDRLASSDGPLLSVAERLGLETIPLPDSRGRRPG